MEPPDEDFEPEEKQVDDELVSIAHPLRSSRGVRGS